MSQVLHSASVETAAGPFALVAYDGAVRAAGFTADVDRLVRMLDGGLRVRQLRRCADLGEITAAVRRYLGGELTACDCLPVVQPGRSGEPAGPFQAAAWQAMRAVPAGRTLTYRELAARAGRPDAARAAGAACAANRVALIVPCHRVLRTGGALGGYLWGLPVKRWLLAHEGVQAAGPDRAAR
ncbi:MAG: methylated-DNA--[protein]-cysteine S-methyltransferase [Carbonactinosporaceae bacterium]